MTSGTTPGSVSIPYIFLRQKEIPDAPVIRVQFPKTFDGLMKSVERLYQPIMTVGAVFTERGLPVKSMNDVVPGAKLLVSSANPDETQPRNAPSAVARDRQIMSKDSFSFLFGNGEPQAKVQKVTDEQKAFTFSDNTKPCADSEKPKVKPVLKRQRSEASEADDSKKITFTGRIKETVSHSPASPIRLEPVQPEDSPKPEVKGSVSLTRIPTYATRGKARRGNVERDVHEDKDHKFTRSGRIPSKQRGNDVDSDAQDVRDSSLLSASTGNAPSRHNKIPLRRKRQPKETHENDRTESSEEASELSVSDLSGPDDEDLHESSNLNSSRSQSRQSAKRSKIMDSDSHSQSQSVHGDDFHVPRKGTRKGQAGYARDDDRHSQSQSVHGDDFNVPRKGTRKGQTGYAGDDDSHSQSQSVHGDDFNVPRKGARKGQTGHARDDDNRSQSQSLHGSELEAGNRHPKSDFKSRGAEGDIDSEYSSEVLSEGDDELDRSRGLQDEGPRRSTKSSHQSSDGYRASHPNRVSRAGSDRVTADAEEGNEILSEGESGSSLSTSSDFENIESSARLVDLFSQLVGESPSLEQKIPKGVKALPELADALNACPGIEEQHISLWRQKLLEVAETQGLRHPEDGTYAIDEMIGRARCLLMDHRFAQAGGYMHRHNLGIIGPRGSGKSTFLRVLTEELIVDLAASGEWKKTFVFILDFAAIRRVIQDYVEFYHAMIAVLMQQIQWQRPQFNKHMRMIQKYFESVTELRNPPVFTKAFMFDNETRELGLALQKVADRLSASWNDSYGLEKWVENVLQLPVRLAKAFGFKKSLMIWDHFETVDITLDGPSSPFKNSDEFVYVIDLLKSTAKNVNYVLACRDQDVFYTLLPSMTADSRTNLQDYIELVSMIGMVQQHEDRQFYVDMLGINVPLVLTVQHCGGIPSYLKLWDQLNELYDEVESGEGDTDELQLFMNAQMQQVLQVLFSKPEEASEEVYEVEGVRRKVGRGLRSRA